MEHTESFQEPTPTPECSVFVPLYPWAPLGLALVPPTPSSVSWEPSEPGAAVEAQTLQVLAAETAEEVGFAWSGAVHDEVFKA